MNSVENQSARLNIKIRTLEHLPGSSKWRSGAVAVAACVSVIAFLPESALAADALATALKPSETISTVLNSDLFTYFAKAVIDVAIPTVAVVVVLSVLFGKDDESEDGSFAEKLFGGETKGGPKPERKSFNLVVQRLNDRFDAVDEVFQDAFEGEGIKKALKDKRKRRESSGGGRDRSDDAKGRRAFERTLAKATRGLDDASIEKVREAADAFRKDLEEDEQILRELSLKQRKKFLLSNETRMPSALGKFFYRQATGSKMFAELTFWERVSQVLPAERREELSEDLAALPPLGTYDPTPATNRFLLRAQPQHPGDDEQGLSTPHKGVGERRGRVFVLKFKGDVQASQADQLRREVSALVSNANATAGDEVVVELDSGGGTVTGYGFAAAQLERLKQSGLHLTVCITEVAASGGYMMACVADKIVAGPLAALGSIGVVTQVPNVYDRLKREGVNVSTITAGRYKRTLTLTSPVTEEDVAKTKEDLEAIYKLFQDFVSRNRPALNITAVATGEVWFGPAALEMGLCDEIKTPDALLLEMMQQGREVFTVSTGKPVSVFAEIVDGGDSAGSGSGGGGLLGVLSLLAKDLLFGRGQRSSSSSLPLGAGDGGSPWLGATGGSQLAQGVGADGLVVSPDQWMLTGYGHKRGGESGGGIEGEYLVAASDASGHTNLEQFLSALEPDERR